MTTNEAATPSITVHEERTLRYEFASGPTTARFLDGLAHGRIWANRTGPDGITYAPPRAYCERTLEPCTEWVELGLEGTVEAATVVVEAFLDHPDPPYAVAYVRLDGADTALVNYVEMDLADPAAAADRLKPGTRLTVEFRPAEQRQGRVTDFVYRLP